MKGISLKSTKAKVIAGLVALAERSISSTRKRGARG